MGVLGRVVVGRAWRPGRHRTHNDVGADVDVDVDINNNKTFFLQNQTHFEQHNVSRA